VELTEYTRRVEDVGLGQFAGALAQSALRSIRLRASVEDSAGEVGTSRLGGLPDLPSTTEWPSNDDEPLSFIAQINLRDVHECDLEGVLPADGLLSFFYDAVNQSAWGFSPADHGAFAVLYTPPSSHLVRRDAPSTLPPSGVFRPVRLTPDTELTFVPWESFTAEAIGMSHAQALEYGEIFEEDDEDYEPQVMHRLLGHPDHVQGDMQLECQLVTNGLYCGDASGYKDPRGEDLKPGAGQWRLLLQIDSEDAAGMMWGDVGRLYYWIKESDLAARDWELSWLVLQCG
jgi:uncharacterized protein YwqG